MYTCRSDQFGSTIVAVKLKLTTPIDVVNVTEKLLFHLNLTKAFHYCPYVHAAVT